MEFWITGLLGESGTSYTGTAFPDSKYYDVYKATSGTTISALTACNGGVYYGHGLSETKRWYNDAIGFVSAKYPWFGRGGYYYFGSSAGVFDRSSSTGKGNSIYGFRSSLVFDGA